MGHRGGAKRCKGKKEETANIKKVKQDFEEEENWDDYRIYRVEARKEYTIMAITQSKNRVSLKVGGQETTIYVDSGADMTIVPMAWYKTGMGKLSRTKDIIWPFGSTKPLDVVAKFQMVLETKRGARCAVCRCTWSRGSGQSYCLWTRMPRPWGSSPSTQRGGTRPKKRRGRRSGGSQTRSG